MMLTPMTPEELKRHRKLGFYKTEADMATDERRRLASARDPGHAKTTAVTGIPERSTGMPMIDYDIQAHDD